MDDEMELPLKNSFCGMHDLSIRVPWFDDEEVAEIKCLNQHIAFPAIYSIRPFNGVKCAVTQETIDRLKKWIMAVEKEFKKINEAKL